MLLMICLALASAQSPSTIQVQMDRLPVVIDSAMSRAEALGKNHFPKAILEQMEVLTVKYEGFDGRRHQGQIVVHKKLATQVMRIFDSMEKLHYPITKVVPIVAYDWDDQKSIDDNNTSAFNYRHVMGPKVRKGVLSNHSYGIAIDLNPKLNPFVSADGKSPRPYKPGKPGVLTRRSAVTQVFLSNGWTWGGSWKTGKDYQHFEKVSAKPKLP